MTTKNTAVTSKSKSKSKYSTKYFVPISYLLEHPNQKKRKEARERVKKLWRLSGVEKKKGEKELKYESTCVLVKGTTNIRAVVFELDFLPEKQKKVVSYSFWSKRIGFEPTSIGFTGTGRNSRIFIIFGLKKKVQASLPASGKDSEKIVYVSEVPELIREDNCVVGSQFYGRSPELILEEVEEKDEHAYEEDPEVEAVETSANKAGKACELDTGIGKSELYLISGARQLKDKLERYLGRMKPVSSYPSLKHPETEWYTFNKGGLSFRFHYLAEFDFNKRGKRRSSGGYSFRMAKKRAIKIIRLFFRGEQPEGVPNTEEGFRKVFFEETDPRLKAHFSDEWDYFEERKRLERHLFGLWRNYRETQEKWVRKLAAKSAEVRQSKAREGYVELVAFYLKTGSIKRTAKIAGYSRHKVQNAVRYYETLSEDQKQSFLSGVDWKAIDDKIQSFERELAQKQKNAEKLKNEKKESDYLKIAEVLVKFQNVAETARLCQCSRGKVYKVYEAFKSHPEYADKLPPLRRWKMPWKDRYLEILKFLEKSESFVRTRKFVDKVYNSIIPSRRVEIALEKAWRGEIPGFYNLASRFFNVDIMKYNRGRLWRLTPISPVLQLLFNPVLLLPSSSN